MIESVSNILGPWSWWILALLLMGLEILVPGTFFLWIGISAFVIGTISLAVGAESTFWVWQTQVIGFVVLSVVAMFFGRRFMIRPRLESGDLDLAYRGRRLVGRTVQLNEAIEGGRGRARIGDTNWLISGPDLPGGAMVRIVDVHDDGLLVEAVEEQPVEKN